MRRHIAKLLALAAVTSMAVLWLAAAPLASAGDPCYHGFDVPDDTSETTTEVKVMPCAFAPTITRVATGSTVTFFNGPDFTHLITGANQAWGSRDVEVRPGTTVAYSFAKAGVYPYSCALHRGMSGVILVGDVASTSAGGTTTADTTTTGSTAAPAPTTPPSSSPIESVALVVGSALAGAVVGASVVWLSTRRRASAEEKATGIA